MKAMALWLLELGVELVVMESTGIYWKSAHAHLERAAIPALVVNAHFIKYVPGRKTDMGDSEWLAVLTRFGLVPKQNSSGGKSTLLGISKRGDTYPCII